MFIPVRVMTEKLTAVNSLQATDFELAEDRIPLRICHFAHVRLPSSVGILLDTSQSMRGPAFDALAIARAGINQFLDTSGPQDEYFLESVNTGPTMQCTFSCDLSHLRARLHATAHGRTSLIDSIYLALNAMRRAHRNNRALLVVSDGYDNSSVYNSEELSRAFTESPIPIFLVLPVDRMRGGLPPSAVESRARDNLLELVNQSGGYSVKVADTQGMLAAATQLASAIRSPYLLYFVSSIARSDTHKRSLRVKVSATHTRPLVLYKAIEYVR